MKKLILLLLAFTVFVNLGFSASKTAKVRKYTPTENNVRLLGRTITSNKTAVMAHAATGLEFNVSAKKLSVTLIKDSWHRDARIVAFLNDERIFDEILREDSKDYVLFDSNEVKTGVVRIVKASECMMANAGIKMLTTDEEGVITPTAAKKFKIEFLGDSATAAYGIDETNPAVSYKIETQDITKSYAYKTALALDADYSILCASGWGVYSGFTDGPRKKDSIMPAVYDKVGFFDVMVDSAKPGERKWDFKRYQPDIVTILFGANDQTYTKKDSKKCSEFIKAYVKFISDIREKNPDAYILCCSGFAPDELKEQIEQAASDYKSQTGDEKVGYLYIPLHDGATEGWGADWHPTGKANTNATKFLVPKLQEILSTR